MHLPNVSGAVLALVLICTVGTNGWAKTVVWDNSGATGEWNTTVDNWVGSNLFAANDTAQFDTSSPSFGVNMPPSRFSPRIGSYPPVIDMWRATAGSAFRRSITKSWPFGFSCIARSSAASAPFGAGVPGWPTSM